MSAPSNFDFLRPEWPALYHAAVRAEAAAQADPRAACFHARLVLDGAVRWLYEHDAALPYTAASDTLGVLVHEPAFRALVGDPVYRKAEAVHRMGNLAAHDLRPVGAAVALQSVRELHHTLYWLVRNYGTGSAPAGAFDPSLVPTAAGAAAVSAAERAQLEAEFERRLAEQIADHERQTTLGRAALDAERARVDEVVAEKQAIEARAASDREDTEVALALAVDAEARLAEAQAEREATRTEVERLREQTATRRTAALRQPDPHNYSEAETRRFRIDLALREVGWDPEGVNVPEYVVDKVGMPGVFKVDYVLWGDDGLPLAVVEAKKASVSADKGREQARQYADALEARFGRRPVVFYTNGYETWLWDDAQGAPARLVLNLYTKEGLEWLVHQRSHRRPLASAVLDVAVAGRPYQAEAARQTFKRFEDGHRRALLSMATGTGKTRTAVALASLLVEHGWTKRVLFLADRKQLVKQALNAFKAFAPDLPRVDLLKGDDPDARVVVSTYPTMANAVERSAAAGGPLYGVDAFGLIIVDEAHRSIYDRYRVLFDYFDGLFIGLTATPRDEVARDTYALFGLKPGAPTFAYGLNEAVAAGYLVPPRAVEAELKFITSGITRDDLSPEEQDDYEDVFADTVTGDIPPHVDAGALNQWLFNEDTVDKAIQLLLDRGIYVAGGDRLAKTIIFARNVEHALFIVKRFAAVAPQLGGDFAEAIYADKVGVDGLIERFSDEFKPELAPHVAVSVDMLDTGFDAPDVANLLVFKPVRSRVKWEQMLGRGTRLRPDLFGPGRDKASFRVFDLCGNFEFFRNRPDGETAGRSRGVGERLFRARLGLALAASRPSDTVSDADRERLRSQTLDALFAHVAGLPEGILALRTGEAARLREQFGRRETWDGLTETQAGRLRDHLGSVPDGRIDGELARQVDLLTVEAQRALVLGQAVPQATREAFQSLADVLKTKTGIPAVAAAEPTLDALRDGSLWTSARPATLDGVRETLSPLTYLASKESEAGRRVYTQFLDAITIVSEPLDDETHDAPLPPSTLPAVTRQQIQSALRARVDHPAVSRLRQNEPIDAGDAEALALLVVSDEVAGSLDAFDAALHATPPAGWAEGEPLALSVRRLVGLDPDAARRSLAGVEALSETQSLFLNRLADELAENGVLPTGRLYESPYTDAHSSGVDGVFGERGAEVLAALRRVEANARPQPDLRDSSRPNTPVETRDVQNLSRILGCLLGGAVGDALGAPVEFRSLDEIRARYGPDGIGDFDRAFGVVGAMTDDTQMTLFTAEGLLRAVVRQREKGICHPPSVVHHAYLRWLHTQGDTSSHGLFRPEAFDGWLVQERGLFARRAPGNTCLSALHGETMGMVDRPINNSKGCGGVMRVAPVGLVVPPGAAFELGVETAALTHGHPSGYLAAGVLAEVVAHLVRGERLSAALNAAEAELERRPGNSESLDAVRAARRLAAEGEPTAERVESLGAGWVAEEALAIAVYCAVVAEEMPETNTAVRFERGVRLAVNHSGDSDSTGAIAGNILGALLGAEAIPQRWRDGVEMADVVARLAGDLALNASGGEILWDDYPGW